MSMDFNPEPSGRTGKSDTHLVHLIRDSLEPIERLDYPDLTAFVERAASSKVVLLGESTHGTKEFYELRAQITKRLIEERGFNIVALEADWPDAEQINSFIHGRRKSWGGFRRFPEWMWRNTSFQRFVHSLKDHNSSEARRPVSIFGLDLYGLSGSMHAVMKFLRERDGKSPSKTNTAAKGKTAVDCLEPWQHNPARYGLAVLREEIKGCESKVLDLLESLHEELIQQAMDPEKGDPHLFSAIFNARSMKSAESYYRSMYLGDVESWNLRDQHMFDTLQSLLDHFGPDSKAVIWEHNSHIGNAVATQMGSIGEINVGQLAREEYGDQAYLTGFMTDHGTVAAASYWDGPVEMKSLLETRSDSFESLLHSTGVPAFFLPLRGNQDLRERLKSPRLERAVGVLYLPESERRSHYFKARISEQFDEIVWIDETTAVEPLKFVSETDSPDLVPLGI